MNYSQSQTRYAYPPSLREPDRESDLIKQWMALPQGTIMDDSIGRKVVLINRGIRNHNSGPDFREVVLFCEGKFIQGQMECHRSYRDWFAHGHGHDRAFQSVKIHFLGIASPQDRRLNGIIVYPPNHGNISNSCDLSSEQIQNQAESSLILMGEERWQTHVNQFLSFFQNQSQKSILCEKAFALLGKGGNEKTFTALGREVFSLQRPASISETFFNTLIKNYSWERCGVRPNHHPEKRFSLARALVRLIETSETEPDHFESIFIQEISPLGGKGIQTELLGNVFYPWLASQAIQEGQSEKYRHIHEKYLSLKLPYVYGKFNRQFKGIFSRKILTRFPVLQGLLVLEKKYCFKMHCTVCLLKSFYGNLDQN